MGTRHYYSIIYVPNTKRKEITLIKQKEYEDNINHDLASRKEFEWWEFTTAELDQDSNIIHRPEQKQEKEAEAADYARKLAKEHGLTFIGHSKTDGILD